MEIIENTCIFYRIHFTSEYEHNQIEDRGLLFF